VKKIRLSAFFILSVFFSLSWNQLNAGTLVSSVNRVHIYENETLALTVQYDSNIDNEEPDIALLKQHFDMISQNKSSSFQLINGRASRSTTWHYELLPKQAGTLLIPSFTINSDFSEAITVEVTPAPKATAKTQNSLYSETTVDITEIYVQQQAIITWRLVSKMDITDAAIAPPQIADTLMQDLGNHQYQRADSEGNIEHVIEQRFSVFPQKSGTLKIPPQQFQVTVHGMRRSTSGIIHKGSNTVRVMTDAQTLNVKPADNAPQQQEWLPAKRLELTQLTQGGSQKNIYKVGEAFTRIVRVQADGISAEQLPPVDMSIDGCKVYGEKPQLKNNISAQGVTGIREEQAAIICTQAGEVTLPEIILPWYDIQTQVWRSATLTSQTIALQDDGRASRKIIAQPAPVSAEDQPVHAAENQQANSLTGRLSRYTTEKYFWPVTILLILLLWAATVWVAMKLLQHRQLVALNKKIATETERQKLATPITSGAVATAIALHDMPALYREVIRWAKQQWPDEQASTMLTITKKLDDAELKRQLELLERHVLAGGPAPDSVELIRAAIVPVEKSKTEKPEKKHSPQLDDLYR
jgi:hypothetical protein